MGEPLSPDRVFDFPKDELEPHPAYDFFTPAPLPGYAGNPNNNNGWLEADDYLLGEFEAMVDEQMVVPAIEEMDVLMIDMEEDLAVLFDDDDFEDDAFDGFSKEEVGGPSTAVAEGPSFPYLASGLPIPPFVIEDLSTRLSNLEYGKGQLVQGINQVSDAEVAASVTIGELGPRIYVVEGHCPVTTEEKAQKTNDVKARSMLLVALPNEHLLTFSQYKDAKTLFEAIQARFANLDTMSIDDLYNNFKIVEQEVKRMVTSSSSSGSQNMAFFSSHDSTNEVDTVNLQVSTVSTPVSTVSSHDNTANLSDATLYAFLATQPNGSLRNQESMPRNQDSSRKTVNVEDTSSKAMVAINGAGFDWSYMADDEVPTNMALMAFSDP
uniref:Uncharacterized protein n=1 Tax=Tanacetum cinerariifolium TaxID=118510 RepID=A0A699IPT6_TANCI|nr:hypothetical protein [Tanacetum cinerariifolium]